MTKFDMNKGHAYATTCLTLVVSLCLELRGQMAYWLRSLPCLGGGDNIWPHFRCVTLWNLDVSKVANRIKKDVMAKPSYGISTSKMDGQSHFED